MKIIPWRKGIKWALWKNSLYAYTDRACFYVADGEAWSSYSIFTPGYSLSESDGIALARNRGFIVGPEPKIEAKAEEEWEHAVESVDHTVFVIRSKNEADRFAARYNTYKRISSPLATTKQLEALATRIAALENTRPSGPLNVWIYPNGTVTPVVNNGDKNE